MDQEFVAEMMNALKDYLRVQNQAEIPPQMYEAIDFVIDMLNGEEG